MSLRRLPQVQYGEKCGPELGADHGEEDEVGGAVGHGHQVVERRQELHPKGQSERQRAKKLQRPKWHPPQYVRKGKSKVA